MITSHASFLTSNPSVEKHHDAEFSLLDPIGNELAKNIVTRIPMISSIICTARELSTPYHIPFDFIAFRDFEHLVNKSLWRKNNQGGSRS